MSWDNFDDETISLFAEDSEKSKKLKDLKKLHDEDLRFVLSTKQGRRFIWELLDGSGIFNNSFNQNAMVMSFQEGNRSFGLRLFHFILSVDPGKYYLLLSENKDFADGK